jgi:hypothetical protein
VPESMPPGQTAQTCLILTLTLSHPWSGVHHHGMFMPACPTDGLSTSCLGPRRQSLITMLHTASRTSQPTQPATRPADLLEQARRGQQHPRLRGPQRRPRCATRQRPRRLQEHGQGAAAAHCRQGREVDQVALHLPPAGRQGTKAGRKMTA